MSQETFDPKELAPLAIGLLAGCGVILFFMLLALALGLPSAFDFGVPFQ